MSHQPEVSGQSADAVTTMALCARTVVMKYAHGHENPGPLSAQLIVNKCYGRNGERTLRVSLRPRVTVPSRITAYCGSWWRTDRSSTVATPPWSRVKSLCSSATFKRRNACKVHKSVMPRFRTRESLHQVDRVAGPDRRSIPPPLAMSAAAASNAAPGVDDVRCRDQRKYEGLGGDGRD
jgi:hypothetical protein